MIRGSHWSLSDESEQKTLYPSFKRSKQSLYCWLSVIISVWGLYDKYSNKNGVFFLFLNIKYSFKKVAWSSLKASVTCPILWSMLDVFM